MFSRPILEHLAKQQELTRATNWWGHWPANELEAIGSLQNKSKLAHCLSSVIKCPIKWLMIQRGMFFFCLKVLRFEALREKERKLLDDHSFLFTVLVFEETMGMPGFIYAIKDINRFSISSESSCEIAEVFRFFHIFSLVAIPGVVYFRSLDFGQHQGTLAYLVENNY